MKETADVTDFALIIRLKQDDEAAFKILFERWFKKLYHFSFRYLKNKELAEEVIQETMLQLWINRQKLDESYPLSPYLFTIARRLSLNSIRQLATSKNVSERLYQDMKASVNTTEDDVLLAELQRITNEALILMPKQQQQVYRLSRNEGYSLDEIAAELGILKNTVKKHLSEALKAIRKHYSIRYIACFLLFYHFFKK
ncbi:RNA polymerase sigma factor [Mucilaginibacter paludis]|uniref:RNA polymerase, sigma-24 subunit, ECF subfamily n=1 Tax=Mucilaginibacter paludis DSM 18603 TaxID=714943 RepID=H1Y333_9SPHI|nr:RNA polymerase sigma-70 factor [Mucilaginibacter paludis]EHQ28851.1 RNA polymerase, sigma-24 subunit, ECF subfamily [Mucilaginibacter paludis DSM 18603]